MTIRQKIKDFLKLRINLSLTSEKAWNPSLWNQAGSQSLSGEVVTEATALTYSAFWNGVTLIAGTVGSLPLHLMQRDGRLKKIADDRPLYNVMHNKWNPYMTAMDGRETMMAHILTWGNGYAEKVKNGYGEIEQLWPIPPNRITKTQMKDGEIIYEIQIDGATPVYLTRDQVMHIPGLGFDGFMGYSVVAMARKSIALGMAMETFGSKFFGEGTHPSGIISHPNQIKDDNMRKALSETYAGLSQSHRLMLLEDGMTFKAIAIPPEDAQFLESRQFQIPEVARWLNLPPHKLKDLTKSSFNNIEAENSSFVIDTILPWLVRLEQNYHMQLLTPREVKERLYFKHIVEGLLRGNTKDRALFYRTMINIGAFSRNEVRQLEDMNPDPNPLADELFVMANLIPLSKFEEYLEKNKNPQPGTENKITEGEDNEKV